MWFEDQVLLPRIIKSFFCMILVQECYISAFLLLLKCSTWNPFAGMIDWFFHLVHWKTLFYQCVLCLTTIAFGVLNKSFYSVEKHVSSTRYEKICQALSPKRIQHFMMTAALGGIISYCCIGLLQNLNLENSSLLSFFTISTNFEQFFIVLHGCYTGVLFSLKYFICFLYLVKFSLSQESKQQHIKGQILNLLKESTMCVLKSLHWYYLLFVSCGPFVENFFLAFGIQLSVTEGYWSLLYSLVDLKLFLVTFATGIVIFFNWSLYLHIFNTFAAERHVFPVEIPLKTDKDKTLAVALKSSDVVLKYLAVLDLRLLSQQDPLRRKQLFSISHPGGHAHHWKAVSEFCISSLRDFVKKLQEYTIMTAAKEPSILPAKGPALLEHQRYVLSDSQKKPPTFSESISMQLCKWPAVAYFVNELPSTKIRKLFAPSQPLIWMSEAFGYLISASYTEDKFGVIQQTLPEIIRLLLDIKMAEEKLPIDLVGIRTHVIDPYGRYEHIHQRVALKSSVNASLCRIADTFKDDISGIYLPEEYLRYLQRYLNRRKI